MKLRSSGNAFLAFLFVGIVAGIACGFFVGPPMTRVAWLGTLFLSALKMLIIPLVASSMIVGISGMGDIRKIGRIGGLTLLYYFVTTGIAVFLGLILVNVIRPGAGVAIGAAGTTATLIEPNVGWSDIVLSLVSPNIVAAAANFDILPIIVFSLIFGGVLTTIGEKGRTVILFFDGVNEALMKMVGLIMWLAPVGVFALIAARLGEAGGGSAVWGEILKIGKYFFTVLLGLSIHALIVLPLLLWFVARRHPGRFALAMAPAVGTAWSTASSSATLPVTIECAEDRAGVSRRSALFVLPLGATVNMDGTALYEAVAAVFIAQAVGVDLGPMQQVVIFVTATLAAIGAAGIPQAGLVTMVIVLRAVGLPLEGIGLLLAVDWFLDRFRTAVNIWGDSVGAAVVDRLFP